MSWATFCLRCLSKLAGWREEQEASYSSLTLPRETQGVSCPQPQKPSSDPQKPERRDYSCTTLPSFLTILSHKCAPGSLVLAGLGRFLRKGSV